VVLVEKSVTAGAVVPIATAFAVQGAT
jgi:hypothetical protein